MAERREDLAEVLAGLGTACLSGLELPTRETGSDETVLIRAAASVEISDLDSVGVEDRAHGLPVVVGDQLPYPQIRSRSIFRVNIRPGLLVISHSSRNSVRVRWISSP